MGDPARYPTRRSTAAGLPVLRTVRGRCRGRRRLSGRITAVGDPGDRARVAQQAFLDVLGMAAPDRTSMP
ncbi:hypothetical protein GCM10010499_34600 [Streptomyces thermoviolaceus subsp. apingens]|nr:hypothetical protein GCM10010499_34600 [Streptomyces thermoviolaceus subsp. apingens]